MKLNDEIDLTSVPVATLEAMLKAGEAVCECRQALRNSGDNVVSELLKGEETFYELKRYPAGGVYDKRSRSLFYYHAQEDFDPRYVSPDGAGTAEVHPALLLQMSANTKSPSFRLAPNTGSILAEAETEFLNPALVGKTLRVSWRVTDAYEKRGRRYYIMEARIEDEDGRPILRRRLHLTFPSQSS